MKRENTEFSSLVSLSYHNYNSPSPKYLTKFCSLEKDPEFQILKSVILVDITLV